jgi:hypothetical protein
MSLDFTSCKYKEIIDAISKSDYEVLTIGEYISRSPKPEKFIIIRHDVDLDSQYQLKFAKYEASVGIKTTYYFRYVPEIFDREIISKVHTLGHEVGYHYEVLTKTKGDISSAMMLFNEELSDFKKSWNTQTICPHGGSFVEGEEGYTLKGIIKLIPKLIKGKKVFSSWSSFDIWDKYNFEDYGIRGDAYYSIDFENILYLSDTGRSWDKRFKRLDNVNSKINPQFNIKNSNQIIELIKSNSVKGIYLLVHNEQWKSNLKDWFFWYVAQIIRRTGKKIIFGY